MKSKIIFYAVFFFLLTAIKGYSQPETFPDAPNIKSYKGIPGKVTKYNNFNFLEIKDETGKNLRKVMGHYWEISYTYDSVFKQKRKFKEFILNQIVANNGSVFFQDTLQVQFVMPSEAGNLWGRLALSNDRVYRLKLIRETPFANQVLFDTKPVAVFDNFVDSVPLPPRLGYLPKSLITRAQHSKYDHQEFTWNIKDTLFRQKAMGPFWDMKMEVRNSRNLVDKQTSSFEILESYYRAAVQSGGNVIKSRPRELLFTLPLSNATLWCRITVSLEGVYFVRALIQADQDRTIPEKMVSIPAAAADSVSGKEGR